VSDILHAADPEMVDLRCNQLGRELALRSVKELGLELNSESRSELAGLAEQICMDFEVYSPLSEEAPLTTVKPEPDRGTLDREEKEGLFSLKKIAPEDRVRRPGLKRF